MIEKYGNERKTSGEKYGKGKHVREKYGKGARWEKETREREIWERGQKHVRENENT